MACVRVTGWRYGFQKVSCTKTVRAHLGLSLSEAKSITNRILDGEEVRLELATDEAAEALAAALRVLGVDATAETARGLRSEGAGDPAGEE